MLWKEKQHNSYPDIILSDCLIVGIQIKNGKIIVDFSEYGFIKKDSKSNKYFRTDGAQVVIEKCDIDNILIKEIRTNQLSEELYFDSTYDIKTIDFLENINTGKWKFEIVEEYYSTGGGLYIGQIRKKEDTFWCCIKISFKNLIYLWNDIKYEFPVN